MKPASPASPMSSTSATSIDEEQIVAAFDTVLEAEIARGRLESDGIRARIVDGNVVGIAQHLSMALGGAKVVVHESDLAAAREILFSPSALVEQEEQELLDADEAPTSLARELTPDEIATRALRASVLGLIFFPPLGHLYSLWLLKRIARTELSESGRRARTISLVIDGVVIVGGFFVGAVMFL